MGIGRLPFQPSGNGPRLRIGSHVAAGPAPPTHPRMRTRSLPVSLVAAASLAAGCSSAATLPESDFRAVPALLMGVEGFSGPEAVRYDPVQDIYFVANFNGAGSALDDNGFISRLRPDGTIEQLRFIAGGTAGVTLHAPRGMVLAGDTLWVADVDAVRAFDRRTGVPLTSVSFASADVGFLNDVVQGPDGALYVTDTGRNRIYRIAGLTAAVAVADPALASPNGITWDGRSPHLVVVPYGGDRTIYGWTPGSTTLRPIGASATGGRYDGVEVRPDGSILVASQADSSIHLFRGGTGTVQLHVAGRPADIGYDSRRNRVAIPYIARNRVEIFQLP